MNVKLENGMIVCICCGKWLRNIQSHLLPIVKRKDFWRLKHKPRITAWHRQMITHCRGFKSRLSRLGSSMFRHSLTCLTSKRSFSFLRSFSPNLQQPSSAVSIKLTRGTLPGFSFLNSTILWIFFLSLGETTCSGTTFFYFLTGATATEDEEIEGGVFFGWCAFATGAALLTWLF